MSSEDGGYAATQVQLVHTQPHLPAPVLCDATTNTVSDDIEQKGFFGFSTVLTAPDKDIVLRSLAGVTFAGFLILMNLLPKVDIVLCYISEHMSNN